MQSQGPLNPKHVACKGHKSGPCFYGGFTPSFPPSNWIFLQQALWQTYIHPLPHTHTSPACHIHYRVQFTYWCAGVTRCVKSIYRDDYLLLLAVHPAIEVFTTSNSALYVTRCRCVNWQDCARELSSSTSSTHGRI